MKLPKRVTIYGGKWRIRYEKLPENVSGLCLPDKRLIYIKEGLEGHQVLATFIHEYLHAAFYELNFHQTNINEDLEELLVEGFTKALLANFKIRI